MYFAVAAVFAVIAVLHVFPEFSAVSELSFAPLGLTLVKTKAEAVIPPQAGVIATHHHKRFRGGLL